jgi:hypothetical protein
VFNTALVGTSGPDILTITANGNRVDINRTLGQPPTYSILASVLTKLSWDGLAAATTCGSKRVRASSSSAART